MQQRLATVPRLRQTIVLLSTLVIFGSMLHACGANQSADMVNTATPAITPVATVAPNARTLPDETTVVEAAPLIETAETEATDIASSIQNEATEVAREIDEEATEIVSDMQQAEPDIPEEATAAEADVQVAELRDYIGQSVAVKGSVIELIGEHAFLLQDPVLLDGDEALVIYDQADFALSEEQNLLVSGDVRRFDLNEIEQITGLDLSDNQVMALQPDVVLIAESIIRTS
jgi:hypothetical protein